MPYARTTLSNEQLAADGVILYPSDDAMKRLQTDVIGRWRDLVEQVATENDVPASWLYGFMGAESWGDPNAISYADARGLMQIMPFNFPLYWGSSLSDAQMADPYVNLTTSARMLKKMRDHGMDLAEAASAYNAGPATSGAGKWTAKADSSSPWGLYAQKGYIDSVVRNTNYAAATVPMAVSSKAPLVIGVASAGIIGWFLYKRYS